MIRPGEIQKIANDKNVRDTQIEKDYIIGWILKGISQNKFLNKSLVFKGGTVLKKVWFPDYRFSEDLDFTFVSNNWNNQKVISNLNEMCNWVFEESRITLSVKEDDPNENQFKCYINYIGPLGGKKDIKCDISTNELISYPIETKTILDDYSDANEHYKISAYSLKESLAEKLRCTIQRTIPRDIYDIWYLTETADIEIEEVAFGFQDKSTHKDLDPLNILNVLKNKETKFKALWEVNLKHQIDFLPPFSEVWRELIRNVKIMLRLLKS